MQSPLLQKAAGFLACYYPLMVLLGVSSAQINAAPKDILEMGAHENCFLVPRLRFLQMAADTNPAVGEWMRRKMAKEPGSQEVKNWNQSLRYGTIVCEGRANRKAFSC